MRVNRVHLATTIAAGLTLVAVTAGAVTPALADPTSAAAPASRPELPPLDPDLLAGAIAGLPNDTMTGAIVTVGGPAGRWSGTSGVSDIHTGAPVRPDGAFRIGSITKVFTATVVLQLVAEHRLDLRRSVQHYLPGLLPRHYPAVMVGQLLNHTSGLPYSNETPQAGDPAWFVAHRFDGWTPRQVVASATTQPMQFTPGTEQRYNGVNYFIAGLLIEKATGHSYADEVRDRVARPLGLRQTYQPRGNDPRILGPHAHAYVAVNGTLYDVTEQSPYSWAEGGMISSTADLTRLIRALYRGHLLPPAQLAQMFTVPPVPYTGGGSNCAIGPDAGMACFSMGLTRTTLPNEVTVWGKSGSVPGYTQAVFATRDLRRVLVYSLNPTGNRDGSEGPYVQSIAAATFDPDLL